MKRKPRKENTNFQLEDMLTTTMMSWGWMYDDFNDDDRGGRQCNGKMAIQKIIFPCFILRNRLLYSLYDYLLFECRCEISFQTITVKFTCARVCINICRNVTASSVLSTTWNLANPFKKSYLYFQKPAYIFHIFRLKTDALKLKRYTFIRRVVFLCK